MMVNKMESTMLKIKYLQKQNFIYLFTIIASYIILFQNRLYKSFPDESDNFVVGWLISKGYVLYRDIFSHHMPFPYYYAGLLVKLGLNDFSSLRIGMGLTILFFWLLIVVIFKNRINYKVLCILIFLYALAHPLFLGHMLLADVFFGYSFLIIFLYFFSKPDLNFNKFDKIMITSMIYISVMSTLISIYPIALLGLYYIIKKTNYFFMNKDNIKKHLFEEISFALIIVTPFILSLVFFHISGSLQDFFDQAYFFNKIYYSQFVSDLTEIQFYQPIKGYIEHIFSYVFNYDWLTNAIQPVKPVSIYRRITFLFEGFIVISNLIVITILWKRGNPSSALLYFLLLGFLRIRAVFHLNPYYLISFFGIGLIISYTCDILSLNSRLLLRKIKLEDALIVCFLAFTLFGTISYAYLPNYIGVRQYNAYESSYDIIIQTLTQPEDPIWVAPIEPLLYFTNDRLPASRYTFYLPWQSMSDKINEEILEDLRVKKPPLIIFERNTIIFERYKLKDYGRVIDDYIQRNYYQVDSGDPIYRNVYLINTENNRLLKTLYDKGLFPRKTT